MSLPEGQPQLVMERASLAELPPLPALNGYRVRTFQPGDEAAWVNVIADAFELDRRDPKLFWERFSDLPFEGWRVGFLCDASGPVATATAWFRAAWGESTGFVHWVAVSPRHQGRGLGYAVSLAAMHRMAEEGRSGALLQTDDFRVPAVRTYLRLGFVPRLVHENQRERWRAVLGECGVDLAAYEEALEGELRPGKA